MGSWPGAGFSHWGAMLSTPGGKLVGVYGWYMVDGGWHGDGM